MLQEILDKLSGSVCILTSCSCLLVVPFVHKLYSQLSFRLIVHPFSSHSMCTSCSNLLFMSLIYTNGSLHFFYESFSFFISHSDLIHKSHPQIPFTNPIHTSYSVCSHIFIHIACSYSLFTSLIHKLNSQLVHTSHSHPSSYNLFTSHSYISFCHPM